MKPRWQIEMEANSIVIRDLKAEIDRLRALNAELTNVCILLIFHYPDLAELLGGQGARAKEILDAARAALAKAKPPQPPSSQS